MKRLIVLMVVMLCLFACSCTKYVMIGDVNEDGEITISDYTLIRLDILGLKELADKSTADVNYDGSIDEKDLEIIRLIILKG